MSGNLKDRPFLLLMLRVMRVMLGICAATLVVVGGAIFYSVTKVQGRSVSELTGAETTGLGIIAFLAAGLFGHDSAGNQNSAPERLNFRLVLLIS
jgi:MFS family permease